MFRKKLTKMFLLGTLLLLLMCLCGGCGNKQLFDTNYTFNRAIIQLADGTVVNVEIEKWNDYDGEQLQIVAKDGTVYLTNSFRCDLIKDN